jgi:adhesin transport system outer membrane protein
MGDAVGPARRAALGLLTISIVVLTASVAAATDLEDEIRTLVDSHPQIRAARENVDSAQAGVSAARSNYYPTAHLTANTGPEFFENSSIIQSTNGPLFMPFGYGAGVTVTQHLYDGNATNSSVDAALDTKSVSDSSLRVARQTAVLEGVNAYLDVLRQGQLVKLARTDETRLQTQLHLEDERVQRGSGVAVDVLAAKHRLQIAKERRVGFEGALEQAIDRYQQVFGHAPPDIGDAAPEPPATIVPGTVDDAMKIALAENPSVEAAKRTVTLTGEKIETARAGYFPTIDLVGKSDIADNRDSIAGRSRDWQVLLQLNWDLFNGFKTQAQVSQAAHDLSASKSSADQAERKAAEAVRLAWSQVMTARERVSILESAVNLAFDVWDSRKKLRESGKATVIDVLDAETDITNAQISLLTATFDRKIATYQLLFSLGRLEPGNLDQVASASPAPAAK